MQNSVLTSIVDAIRSRRFLDSIALMRDWLAAADVGEPEALLREASDVDRPKVAMLMRDILTMYPSTLLGAPVLLHYTPEGSSATPLVLPFPAHTQAQPCANLHFLGWLSATTPLPLKLPFRPEKHPVTIEPGTIHAAVALFRKSPEAHDLEELDISPLWWGELFLPVAGSIEISARILLPYTDALETSRVMQSAARGAYLPERSMFIGDAHWAFATNEGLLFQETCRGRSPNHADESDI